MPHRDASAAHWRSRGAAASAPLPEDHPEAFLELVRGPEGLVGVRDVLEPGALGGVRSDSVFSSAHRAPLIGSLTPLRAVPDLLVSRHAERS